MNKVSTHLKKTLSGTVSEATFDAKSNQEVIWVKACDIHKVARVLKDELRFDVLIDILGVDWLGKKELRFEIFYLFYNTTDNERVQINCVLENNAKPTIDSILDVYPAADWAERECFDMYGYHFNNHPNLKRLLMWTEFKGHPLRKDYKLDHRQPIPVLDELV